MIKSNHPSQQKNGFRSSRAKVVGEGAAVCVKNIRGCMAGSVSCLCHGRFSFRLDAFLLCDWLPVYYSILSDPSGSGTKQPLQNINLQGESLCRGFLCDPGGGRSIRGGEKANGDLEKAIERK